MKKCCTCKEEKSLDNFRKDRRNKDGLHLVCNSCNSKNQRDWYKKNPEHVKAYAKKRYHENKIAISNRRKELLKANPEKYRVARRKLYNPLKAKEYAWKQAGINMKIDQYEIMLKEQNNACAICFTPQSQLKRKLNVDHNHETGQVRALLCDSCNRGIGYFKESLEIIERAKNYLICHNKKPIG